MKKAKKFLYLFIILFFIQFIFIHTSFAVENTNNLKIYSPSYILMEASTGKILAENNPNEVMPPASTTKIMTAILTVENCKLDEIATVSHNAIFSVPPSYSIASLREGEELTVEQLLNVLLIQSANDAANVLAEHIAGSVEEFAKMMNDKAKELGCKNTNFVNANGVEEEDHYSTAYDLALIGKYAMQFNDIMRIAMVNQYTLPKTNKYDREDRIFNTTNGLVTKNSEYYYPETTGMKTGYTDKSGYCIVTTAKKDDVELIAVVLGSNTIKERYEDCIKLFNYGFDNYSYQTLNTANEVIDAVEIAGATKETKSLDIVAKDDINVLAKNNISDDEIKKTVEINENLSAPIEQNAVVGKLSYEIDGETYSTDLIASNSVVASNFETILFRALLIFLILFLLVVILKTINKPRKPKSSDYTYGIKHSKKSKRVKSKKGGRYKFTRIN